MYFLYSVDVHVQQNVPGGWKTCNYICQGNHLAGGRSSKLFCLFVLFRSMFMAS